MFSVDLPRRLTSFLQRLLAPVCMCLLTACASSYSTEPVEPIEPVANLDVEWVSAFSTEGSTDLFRGTATTVKWQHRTFPGKKPTTYYPTLFEGRNAIRSESKSAASMLRQSLRVEPADLGKLRFSWKVPELITGADLSERDTADSPVRIVLAFEGDRSKFSTKNAMLSELAQALTGEALPYATLVYVWGNHQAPGTIITNARTDRVRKLVIESGPKNLGQWLDYERDVSADYGKAFGEAPGALVGIAIMTDTDNTRQQTSAWYGPIKLLDKPIKAAAAGLKIEALADNFLKQ